MTRGPLANPTSFADPILRVGLVARSMAMGGAENHILKLCQTIQPSEAAISLFLLCNDEPNPLLGALPAHISVSISPFRRHHPKVLGWLSGELRRRGCQVAHSFLWTPDAYSALSSALCGWGPLIVSDRGDRFFRRFVRMRNLFDRMVTFRVAACVCVNSRAGQRNLLAGGCPASKIEYIHNGVNLELIDAAAPQPVRAQFGWNEPWPIIGTVSRLVDFKGVDTLLRAVAGLLERQPAYCVIVGDGPQRPALEQLAAQLGLGGQVAFVGFQSPAYGYVKVFDIAVQASRREQGSNSILEYMACGLPVVATRVGGNPEFVMDGQTGVLVERDDAPGMSDALAALLSDRESARRMGCRGRSSIERDFQMSIVADKFVQLWRKVALNRSAAVA